MSNDFEPWKLGEETLCRVIIFGVSTCSLFDSTDVIEGYVVSVNPGEAKALIDCWIQLKVAENRGTLNFLANVLYKCLAIDELPVNWREELDESLLEDIRATIRKPDEDDGDEDDDEEVIGDDHGGVPNPMAYLEREMADFLKKNE